MKLNSFVNGMVKGVDSPVIQYIENGDAELASPLPSTYTDAAGTQPVDGTGSPTNPATELSLTRSNSSPLRGGWSWLYEKRSGNQQGKGGAWDFSIDPADVAKILTISFDIAVLSGTYVTGDVGFYVVDVTNGTVIQPSGFQVENVGIVSKQTMTFQTAANSLSYRLCVHVASTSTSAYALKLDNVSIISQAVPQGSIVGPWTSFTPLWQSNGTAPAIGNGSIAGRWRQVGGAADIEIRLSLGSTSTTGTGTSFITWPSFMNLQPLNGSFSEGTCFMYTSTTATSRSGTPQFYNTERRFGVYLSEVGQWGGGATDWGGAGDTMTITVRGVPVVGWSSSTVVSSSADTRVVAFNATTSTTVHGSISNGAVTTCVFGTTVTDTHGGYNSSTGEYTVKVPGWYNITGIVRPTGTYATAAQYETSIYVNGAKIIGRVDELSSSFGNTMNPMVTLQGYRLNAGDVVTIRGLGTNWTALSCASGSGMHYFSISQAQGPSQIAMSEIIAMQANTCSNTVTGLTALVFSAKNFDTHNSYNTSTGIYTVPAPGLYEVDFTIHTNSASWTAGQVVICYVYKNGSPVGDFRDVRPATSSVQTKQSGTMLISCVAGDTLAIRSDASITYTADGSAIRNFFAVKRLGGM